jgi:hypothetical protein
VRWHAIHAGEKLGTKRGGEASLLDLNISLFPHEYSFLLVKGGWPSAVVDGRIPFALRVSPRPETLSQASTNGSDEGWVRMI